MHFHQHNHDHPGFAQRHHRFPNREFQFRHVPARNADREDLLDEFNHNYNRTHRLLDIIEGWETDIQRLIAYSNGQQNAARYDRRRDLYGAVQRLSRLNVELEDAVLAFRGSTLEDVLRRYRPRARERRDGL
ncbi:hypothetical protein E8E13_005506 [Curvularia kusanoi]|uniref:Uncharacterized protein n=1 Tax=Curvularia kusanoi TaxID=90978 RepID=A0A9P4W8T4_CURKU|nr:hypothetical protein E8E13_005506 [Curvularia kusanoi]